MLDLDKYAVSGGASKVKGTVSSILLAKDVKVKPGMNPATNNFVNLAVTKADGTSVTISFKTKKVYQIGQVIEPMLMDSKDFVTKQPTGRLVEIEPK